MYWDVKTVKPLPDFRIYVEIEDGRTAPAQVERIAGSNRDTPSVLSRSPSTCNA